MSKDEFSKNIQTSAVTVKPQYLTFMTMLYVTFTLIGCPVLYKLIKIGFITAPGGLLPLPIVLLLEDIIAEVYGYRISRILLWYLLTSMLLFIFFITFIINLPSPGYWHNEAAFHTVLGPLSSGVPIMVFGIFCGRFSNLFVITKLKIFTRGKYFWLRSIFSCLVGDIVALTIIYNLAFWSLPFSAKLHLFLSDMSVRVGYSIIGGFLGTYFVNFLKKKEGIDVYDLTTNFNPFKLNLNDKK